MSSPTSSEPRPAPAGAQQAPAAPPERGELGAVSPLRLYSLAASSHASGRLALELQDWTVELHFRKGQPIFVDSSRPEDALGAYLLRERLLSAEQLAQAEAAKGGFGSELLGALVGLGLMPPPQAFVALTQRAHELMVRAVLAESGRFHFGPSDLPLSRALPLGDRWGLLSALMRRVPGPELRRRLTPVLTLPVVKSGGQVDTSELRLTPQEARTLGRFDGVRSLEQLLEEAPEEAEHLLRLAFLLRELEALSFFQAPSRPVPPPRGAPSGRPPPAQTGRAGTTPRPPRPAPPVPPPVLTPSSAASASGPKAAPASGGGQAAAVSPSPSTPPPSKGGVPPVLSPAQAAVPPPPLASGGLPHLSPTPQAALGTASIHLRPAATPVPEESEAQLATLRALLGKLKEQNHFERLGVPKKADTGAVKAAYFKLAHLYHPDTVPPGAPPEMAGLKEGIFAAIGEAYRTLGDDAKRAQYLQELETGGGEVDVLHILKAEDLFNKARILVKARRFAEAVKLLEDAVVLNPEEGEFYAWRGYARFFLHEDRQAGRAEAVKDLQEALRRNPRCVPAHFFMGQVTKLAGNPAGALEHFKRTLELKPDHIDAAREVRLMSGKK